MLNSVKFKTVNLIKNRLSSLGMFENNKLLDGLHGIIGLKKKFLRVNIFLLALLFNNLEFII